MPPGVGAAPQVKLEVRDRLKDAKNGYYST